MRAYLALALVLLGCAPDKRGGGRVLGGRPDATAGDASQPADASSDDASVIVPNDAGSNPDSGQMLPDAGDLCLEGPEKRARSNIFYGTDLPSYVPLSTGQIQAVGNFFGCSGLLIAPTWVLTAEHCGLSAGNEFCIGVTPGNANVCISIARAIDHPSADMTLVELDQPAGDLLPSVEPVPALTESLDQTWIGRTAEAAGYGQQEDGDSDRREFVAEAIYDVDGDLVSIDGMGVHGVCFGDSGGPLMVIASDGSARVAGALSFGDESCVGIDNFTRVDTYLSWIESYTGPTIPTGPQPCGTVTTEGQCSSDRRRATWCGPNNELQNDSCGTTEICGFDTVTMGSRCIPASQDPCQGLTFEGECSSNVLRWCDGGQLFERNCPLCGETCLPTESGFNCVSSNCGDVDYLGKCEGNTAVWCNTDGELSELDCTNQGQTCGYVDDTIGWYCQ
jgi:hypothetical protein